MRAAHCDLCTPAQHCHKCNAGYELRGHSCANINACHDYPCSVFSAGCTDLPPPAGNGIDGRTCKACNVGYHRLGDACIDRRLIAPKCHCPAEVGWVATGCGRTDSKVCSVGQGYQYRKCLGHASWALPDASHCADRLLSAPQVTSAHPCRLTRHMHSFPVRRQQRQLQADRQSC